MNTMNNINIDNNQRISYRYEFELPLSIVASINKLGENFNTEIPVAEDSIGILSNVIVTKENDVVKLYITVNKDEARPRLDGSGQMQVPGIIDDFIHRPVTTADHCTQTEPVTIIIGDASTLLDKIHKSGSDGILKGAGDSSKILSFPRQQPKGRPTNLARQGKDPGRATHIIDYQSTKVIQPVITTNYNCPLCSKIFGESPLLYDHLQTFHLDQCKKIKKPKGREGKTIYLRNRTPSIPVISPLLQQQMNLQQENLQQQLNQQQENIQQHQILQQHQQIQNNLHMMPIKKHELTLEDNGISEVYLDPISAANVQVADFPDHNDQTDGQIVYTTVDYVDSFAGELVSEQPPLKRLKDDDLIEEQVNQEMIILNN